MKNKPSSSFKNHPTPREVIPEILSPSEFERRAKDGIEIHSKLLPGRIYLLRWKQRVAVLEDGRPVGFLCVRPCAECDDLDEQLSFYLLLVLNERRLLSAANFIPERPHYRMDSVEDI